MRIQINGEEREFPHSSLSLTDLIETLTLPPQRIAVEVNKTIVPRSLWETTKLNDEDRIEIVHFVGGGYTNGGTGRSNYGRLLFNPRTV